MPEPEAASQSPGAPAPIRVDAAEVLVPGAPFPPILGTQIPGTQITGTRIASASSDGAGATGTGSNGVLDIFDPGAIPAALLLLFATMLALRVLRRSADAWAQRRVERRLAIKQTMTLIELGSYAVATMLAASLVLELSTQALLALSGTLALAGGFLLRDLGESVMAGLSILLSRPFQVGDRITFGGHYGEVREIGLRTIRLVTLDDNLVTIPCAKILTEPVASANAGELACMVVIPFYLAASADHRRAREIVEDAVLSSRFLDLKRPRNVLLSLSLHEGAGTVIQLTAKAYVFDTRHEKEFLSDVTDRVLFAFRQAGIPLAAHEPHRASLPALAG